MQTVVDDDVFEWASQYKWWAAESATGFFYQGCFTSEIDAAKAYFNGAAKLFGDFAKTNLEVACQAQ